MTRFKSYLTEIQMMLQYHDTFNPALWDGDVLKSEVRSRLLQIAEEFRVFIGVAVDTVTDIILTGGSANYNYTPLSDIDLHLVVDYNKVTTDKALFLNFIFAKKSLWANTFDIKIKGYKVELFAQDVTIQPHIGQGVYSLKEGAWIQKPQLEKHDFASDPMLLTKTAYYMKRIDNIVYGQTTVADADALKEELKNMRYASIAAGGEFSMENLVFKELRDLGYLQKLSDWDKNERTAGLSLESIQEKANRYLLID